MKNINTNKIWSDFDRSAMVQFKIMEWKSENTLQSLKNPVDIVEARSSLSKYIIEVDKFKKYIPLDDKVLDNVLLVSFNQNLDIDEGIDLFIRKNTSLISATRIDAVMVLWKIANNPSYEPESKLWNAA